MLTTIQGVYRDGQIELLEKPSNLHGEIQVIVTFLTDQELDLRSRGISESQAAYLRGQLAAFAEDWDSPEMDIYNHVDRTIGILPMGDVDRALRQTLAL
jgi:hypothetical protein